VELGVPFASEGGTLHLTREGGHSHRRIVHVADATGAAVQQALEKAALKHPNITLIPDMGAVDMITGRHATNFSTSGAVHGLYAYNRRKKRVEALTAGVLEVDERAMVSGMVRLADRPVREVMTPRMAIDWIDIGSSVEEIREALLESPHSRIPVAAGAVENIVGVIQTRDVMAAAIRCWPAAVARTEKRILVGAFGARKSRSQTIVPLPAQPDPRS
jgi:hypothetical protein